MAIVARAIEVAPGGVDDLIEALRQGVPLYESDGVYPVSPGAVVTAQEFKQLDALAEQETAAEPSSRLSRTRAAPRPEATPEFLSAISATAFLRPDDRFPQECRPPNKGGRGHGRSQAGRHRHQNS